MRVQVLLDAIKNQTPLETTKGKVTLNWISDADRISAESGDFITAFKKGRGHKSVFVTDAGDNIKLTDILKTAAFGGGRGSGGGAEQTGLMECAQCIYAAAIFKGAKLSEGGELDASEWGTYSSSFDVDYALDSIEDGFTQAWMDSSILIGNELKKNLKGTNYTWHRGSAFVKEIENKFKELNKAEKPKPFSDINKWTPADIWAVKNGVTFDFNQFSTLGEYTNELKQLYDSQDLVGISLKFASGSVTTEEKNTTGFIRRPVAYKGYVGQSDFFKSKDVYLKASSGEMQLRTFGDPWQGQITGLMAGGGKIGGGNIDYYFEQIYKQNIYPTGGEKAMKGVVQSYTDDLKKDFWKLYHLCVFGETPPKVSPIISQGQWITQSKTSANNPTDEQEFYKLLDAKDGNWRYSKYMCLKTLEILLSGSEAKRNEFITQIWLYAASNTNQSSFFIKIAD